jgi:hypothetical protein
LYRWLDVIDTCCCNVPSRHLQRCRRNIVQQLQRWLRMRRWIDVIDAT